MVVVFHITNLLFTAAVAQWSVPHSCNPGAAGSSPGCMRKNIRHQTISKYFGLFAWIREQTKEKHQQFIGFLLPLIKPKRWAMYVKFDLFFQLINKAKLQHSKHTVVVSQAVKMKFYFNAIINVLFFFYPKSNILSFILTGNLWPQLNKTLVRMEIWKH